MFAARPFATRHGTLSNTQTKAQVMHISFHKRTLPYAVVLTDGTDSFQAYLQEGLKQSAQLSMNSLTVPEVILIAKLNTIKNLPFYSA